MYLLDRYNHNKVLAINKLRLKANALYLKLQKSKNNRTDMTQKPKAKLNF